MHFTLSHSSCCARKTEGKDNEKSSGNKPAPRYLGEGHIRHPVPQTQKIFFSFLMNIGCSYGIVDLYK